MQDSLCMIVPLINFVQKQNLFTIIPVTLLVGYTRGLVDIDT